MPPKPKAVRKRPSAKRSPSELESMARVNVRAARLIEMLLKRLEEGVAQECADKTSPHWRRLFGSTQSAVVNVQKLVAALGALPQLKLETDESDAPPEVPMTKEELAMLRDWLNLGDF